MAPSLTIVIPAYNEGPRLAEGHDRLRPVLEVLGADATEVVVVDDGSTDDTARVAHDVYGDVPHLRVIQQPDNRGKGAAVRLGIAVAEGERVIVADADMAINPRHFPSILDALLEHQLAPGTRATDGHIDYDQFLRTLAGGVFNRLVHHYVGVNVRDTQCGCKGYQRGPARLLGLLGVIDRFAFDVEVFYLANALGLSVEPVPVTWDDVTGSSVRMGRDSFAMLRDLRGLSRTRYENPVVELGPDVALDEVANAARQTRSHGLVLARGERDALVVLARDGAVAGLGIATSLGGILRTATLPQLVGRTYEAV